MTEYCLDYAIVNGDLLSVRELIDFGVNVNGCISHGETPLIVAAKTGHREIFDLLIQYGAQVNYGRDSDGLTPLHWASCNGWVDQVQLILEKGVDVNDAAKDGETPLILAATNEHRDVFDLLIQYEAQVNCGKDSEDWTLLHWVSYRGWVDQVRLILEKGGADLNATGKYGDTPLSLAAVIGHREVFDLLLQYGAQVNCGGDFYGRTSLYWASCNGWVDQVRLILEKGDANLNAAGKYGETPLIVAARKENREIFDLLIQYGAQDNCTRDMYGKTLLYWASCNGWVDQVRLILEKGDANLNAAGKDEETPLIVAARKGNREIFILLFQYGATLDIDYALISKHSFLEVILKDVNLCAQLIVDKFHCQSLLSLYRNPDIAKKLPFPKKTLN